MTVGKINTLNISHRIKHRVRKIRIGQHGGSLKRKTTKTFSKQLNKLIKKK